MAKKVIELFAGQRSFGKVAQSLGMTVFSVDWKETEGIDLICDVASLNISDFPFVPDIVWASPDCTTYTVSAIGYHRDGIHPKTAYAKECDKINKYLLKMINQWLVINPKMIFFIENPRGMLRKMPFMQSLTRKTVWYCQYGDTRAKPTDIWTNSVKWIPRPECANGNRSCHHQAAPRGSQSGTQGLNSKKARGLIPKQLSLEILKKGV
jgi:site-specific DNA-cytosine methylase